MDFNQEFGGLTPTDEEAAFGDPFLMQAEIDEENEASEDPLLEDPEVQALEAQAAQEEQPGDPPRPKFTFLRITWGMLDGPVDSLGQADESVDILDWSGLLAVDRGIVVVRRVIRFERPYDHLVLPRLDRQTVAWFSHTGCHFDGLLVEIIERPQDLVGPDGVELEPNVLHFTTGPYSNSFVVAELPDLDEVYPVDPDPNAIHFTGFRLSDISLCPKGFLSGIWHAPAPEDSVGFFRGKWVGLFGHLHGFLRGAYGYTDEGERVFFGKYISRNGQFRGLLKGRWEPLPQFPGHGIFRGRWVNAAGNLVGVLGGQYLHLPERPGGFFGGRWAALCDPDAVDEIDE